MMWPQAKEHLEPLVVGRDNECIVPSGPWKGYSTACTLILDF